MRPVPEAGGQLTSGPVLVRAIEADLLPVTERYGLGVLRVRSPTAGCRTLRPGKTKHLASGHWELSRRYDPTQPKNQRKLDVVTELATLADKAGANLVELSIAFVLTHPAVSSAIICPRTIEQFETQLAAPGITLADETLALLTSLCPRVPTSFRGR